MRRAAPTIGAAVLVATCLAACGAPAGRASVPTKTVVVTKIVAAKPARAARKAVPVSPFKQCDANIRVRRRTTSCGFGENVFYGFWKAVDAGDDAFAAYSPATGHEYDIDC